MDDEAAMGLTRVLPTNYDDSRLCWIFLLVLIGDLEALDIQTTE